MSHRQDLSELRRLKQALREQDNRLTADPIFLVEECCHDYGMDLDYCENIAWIFDDYIVTRDSPPQEGIESFEELESHYSLTGKIKDDWMRTGYRERWEYVQPFLTEAAADDYIAKNAHRHRGKLRTYVDSGYRNPEWKLIRQLIGSLALKGSST